jgi:ABC-type branched-subunit amino acid transport system substrate-binding protein
MKKILLFLCIFLSSAATAEPIKIGVVSILSGEMATLGTDFVRAIEIATEKHNKDSDVKFQLIVEDDAFSQSKGLSAVKKLLEVDKVQALINLSTPTINSSYQILTQKKIPVMQLGLFENAQQIDNIFMLQGKLEPAVMELAKFVSTKAQDEPTEIFYFEDPSVVYYIDLFKKEFTGNLSITAAGSEPSAFQSLVSKSIQKGTKHVIIALTPEPGSEIMKRFSLMKSFPQYYSLWSLEILNDKYFEKLGQAEQLLNTYYTNNFEAVDPEFIKVFKTKFGNAPQSMSEFGHDCLQVLAQTYSEDRNVWLEKIASYQGQGVSGLINFDNAGNRIAKVEIKQIKDIVQ